MLKIEQKLAHNDLFLALFLLDNGLYSPVLAAIFYFFDCFCSLLWRFERIFVRSGRFFVRKVSDLIGFLIIFFKCFEKKAYREFWDFLRRLEKILGVLKNLPIRVREKINGRVHGFHSTAIYVCQYLSPIHTISINIPEHVFGHKGRGSGYTPVLFSPAHAAISRFVSAPAPGYCPGVSATA